MKHIYLVAVFAFLLSGCSNAPNASKPAGQIGEGGKCQLNQECQAMDCSVYDSPVKSGYVPECLDEICKCMCRGCL